jgi:hypothetical protein
MDNEVAISQAQAAIPSAAGHYHRLIAVVDESPTPTSDLGVKASERIGCERVVLGMELPPLLLPLSVRQRKLRTPQLVDQLVSSRTGDVVVVDRIEVLFDRSLEINALKCLLNASRSKTLVVIWPGGLSRSSLGPGTLTWATPDHPDYGRFPIEDFTVIGAPV